jgi:hypothetical protein
MSFGFWEQLPKQAQELRHWLLKPSTLSWLESSAHLMPNDGYEHLFGPALQIIGAEATVMLLLSRPQRRASQASG